MFGLGCIEGRYPHDHLRPAVRVRLRLAEEFADAPGDVSFAEKKKTDAHGQRVFVGPAEMDFRRLAHARQFQRDRGDHVGDRGAALHADHEAPLLFQTSISGLC